jgi:DNA-binding Lrp family transcriptional regulator
MTDYKKIRQDLKQEDDLYPFLDEKYTQIPNEIFDTWFKLLTPSQNVLVMVFWRLLYGYNRKVHPISFSLLSAYSGLSDRTCKREVKNLIKFKIIKLKSRGGVNKPNQYGIRKLTENDLSNIICNQINTSSKGKNVTTQTDIYDNNSSDNISPPSSDILGKVGVTECPTLNTNRRINKNCEIKSEPTQETLHREQKTELAHTSKIESYSMEKLLEKSNNFLQQVGFGFSKNPRYILDQIYKLLPDDYQVKEDAKDVDILKQAIEKFESGSGGDRDAISKKLFQGVEAMAKLYLIKKYGEEFRDVLYPKILNDNLILYLNCNPTLKYCLQGFSNDIDGVYSEINRIVRKRQEQEERDRIREEERYLERERIKAEVLARPHYSDEDIHAMGLRTVPEILQAMQGRDGNSEELDKKYQATDQTITDRERERLGELLRIKISKGNLDLSEENEYLMLNRKMKGNG